MKTFDQAMAIVAKELLGTPDLVSGEGWEDDRAFLVGITVPPLDFGRDRPAFLIDKRTGRLTKLTVIDHLDRIARMMPLGAKVTRIPRRTGRLKR